MATSILTRSKLNKVFLVVLITAAMTAMAAEALADDPPAFGGKSPFNIPPYIIPPQTSPVDTVTFPRSPSPQLIAHECQHALQQGSHESDQDTPASTPVDPKDLPQDQAEAEDEEPQVQACNISDYVDDGERDRALSYVRATNMTLRLRGSWAIAADGSYTTLTPGNPKPPSMSDALWYSPALL